MSEKGFSERNIEGAGIRHDPRGWGISTMYGIVTRAGSWDHKVEIGDSVIEYTDLERQLEGLSERTGRDYTACILTSDENPVDYDVSEEERLDAVCTIGVDVPSIMQAQQQSHDGLVAGKTLQKIICQSGAIIDDLKSLGFKDIGVDDLYLHANAYDH
jgi:hypothetical protein